MIKIKLDDAAQVNELLDSSAYNELIGA
jgi:hypothetical protein